LISDRDVERHMLLNTSFIAFLLGAFSLVGAMISTSDADAHRQLFRRLGFTCPILPIPTPRVKLYQGLSCVCFT
jgi:hypothetical protein